MPRRSRWSFEVPRTSIPSYVFGSQTAKLPDDLAFADADHPDTLFFTVSSFREWSKRFAAGLIAAGLQPGDRVLISSINDVFYPIVFMGILMARGVYTSANARSVARELAQQLGDSKATFMLASDATLQVALEAAGLVGMSRDRVFIFNDEPLERPGGGNDNEKEGVKHWKHLIASPEIGRRFAWKEMTPEEAGTCTAALNYSSGTTGNPKGVESTHFNYIANASQTDYVMNLNPRYSTHEKRLTSSRWLCMIPLYHGFAQCYFITIATKRRVPWYVMKHYDLERMLGHIQRSKISELFLVPPIAVAMTRHAGIKRGQYDLSSVNMTLSCAAPLGAEVSQQYEALWPKGAMNVKQGYAMSESTCNIMGWDPRLHSPPGSVGELMPNCEVKLMDDDGTTEVSQGQRGEIWFKGPNIMKGYLGNPQATRETITEDGWLKTGDIATIDKDGYYYIVDRKKELIKVKGVQVAPAELESLLLDHPEVVDAAVIGVKSDEDEVPRAYIVRKQKSSLSEKDILRFMEGKVSKIKRISGGIVFTDVIPRTAAGKILRRLLREQAAKERAPALASKL